MKRIERVKSYSNILAEADESLKDAISATLLIQTLADIRAGLE
jgi:hypothetical protein